MALVLTRMSGQSVQIGKDIIVTVDLVPGSNGKFKIIIDAPRNLLILRKEMLSKTLKRSF